MALRLFVVLACVFLLLTSREPPWADAHVVYDTAQAIVDRHELAVTLDGPSQFFSFQGGKKYGVFPLGNVIAMVPSYLVYKALARSKLLPDPQFQAMCSHLSPALLMAAAGVVFYRLLRRRGATENLAALLTLGCGLSTLCFGYARVPYSEALQTLFLLLLTSATLRAAERLSLLDMLGIGVYAGVLFNSKLVNALLLPLPVIYIAWQRIEKKGTRALGELALAFTVGLLSFAPFVALALWHNQVKTGSLWDTGYQIPHGIFSGDLLPDLYGFFLSPGKSMFLYSPPLFLVPFALKTAWRKNRAETAFILSLIVVALLWNAKFRNWHGDYCWGPRHMAPFHPLMLLLLVPWLPEALARGQTELRKMMVVLLFLIGFSVQLLGAAFYWDHYIRIVISVKDQTGASGWFQEQLGHAHYMPQFSPLRGHLWLLRHKLRKDPDLNSDAPWKLLVPQNVSLVYQYDGLRFDWWLLDFFDLEGARKPSQPPLERPFLLFVWLGILGSGLLAGSYGIARRLLGKSG